MQAYNNCCKCCTYIHVQAYLCIIYVYVFRLGSKLVYLEFFLNIYFYQSGTVQIVLLLVHV